MSFEQLPGKAVHAARASLAPPRHSHCMWAIPEVLSSKHHKSAMYARSKTLDSPESLGTGARKAHCGLSWAARRCSSSTASLSGRPLHTVPPSKKNCPQLSTCRPPAACPPALGHLYGSPRVPSVHQPELLLFCDDLSNTLRLYGFKTVTRLPDLHQPVGL